MKNFKDYTIPNNALVRDALEKLDGMGGQCIYIVDEHEKVCGSLTDGDVRRALIKGHALEDSVTAVMQPDFIYVPADHPLHQKRYLLEKNGIDSCPVIDKDGKLLDIFSYNEPAEPKEVDIVILAGGLGKRLGEITNKIPKPMVDIAGKPMVERIIEQFVGQGFRDIYMSVNYKADVIEDHFKCGQDFDCKITYLKENKRLGTAGPLSLLPKGTGRPVIIMNGDLLTNVDFTKLLDFHKDHHAKITMCVRGHEVQVPFGVVELEDGIVSSFVEKPAYSYSVNAGIYILDHDVLSLIPEEEYYDMSSLLHMLLEKKEVISSFPIMDGWIDVGRESDLAYAREFFSVGKDSDE